MRKSKISLFQGKKVRKIFFNNEWWFVINDVVQVLTDTPNVSDYIKKFRLRDKELNKGWGQFVTPLSVQTEGGIQKMNCASTEGILRIIQSITSPKAEPFKRWLARVGYERIQEIANPELTIKRIKALYKAKGYSANWIEKRLRGITVRENLTKEWSHRGVKEGIEYSILTSEISKATFGITPKEHKKIKGLKAENLRDHMTHLELDFNTLGESATAEISKAKNAKGFIENKTAAIQGGLISGKARKNLEEKTGKKIVSKDNFLQLGGKKQEKLNKG